MAGFSRLVTVAVSVVVVVGLGAGVPSVAAPSSEEPLSDLLNNVSITDAETHDAGQLDSTGSSFRAAALREADFGPGADVVVDGLGFTMPDVTPGEPDNFTPGPERTSIKMSGAGNAIAFLGTAGAFSGLDITVTYTDRTTERPWVGMPSYTTVTEDPLNLSARATTLPGRNTTDAPDVDLDSDYAIFKIGVNIDPSKTVRSITLAGIGSVHLYDLKIVTVDEPFAVDSVQGRTPQPDEVPCDPRLEGEEACGPYNYWENADPSAHLRYFPASGVTPKGATAFYNEITVKSSAPATYFMTAGYRGGYYGIQEYEDGTKVAIFSIFGPDKGTVDDDLLTSHVLHRIGTGDFVIHGEYAGGPSIRIPFDWQVGKTYATMITNQPDTTQGSHAQIVTAWLNTEPVGHRRHWVKLMTVRTERPADSATELTGLYSFVEDFVRDGSFTEGRERAASFGNSAVYSSRTGWRPTNRIGFTGQLSGRYTVQNDAYPTAGKRCAITEKITGGDIPVAEARSGFGTIWDASRCARPKRLPKESLAPLKSTAPIQQATTFLVVTATANAEELTVTTALLANDEPVQVSVDGTVVSSPDLTASSSGTLDDAVINLSEPLSPGEHTVKVRGLSSNLTGSVTLQVP